MLRSARAWIALAAIVLAAAVAFLLVMVRRTRSEGEPGKPSVETELPASGGSSGRSMVPAYRRSGHQRGDDGGPSPATSSLVLDLARRQIRLAAKPCYLAERGDPSGTMRFRYSLVQRDGQARASDLVVLESTLRSPTLETCVVEKLGTAVWPAGEGEDAILTVEDTIGVTDIPL